MFKLVYMCVYFPLYIATEVSESLLFSFLLIVFALGLMIPSLAVTVRRLHDTGRSGSYAVLCFVPIANLVIFYFSLLEGDSHANEYGPDPKEEEREMMLKKWSNTPKEETSSNMGEADNF